MLAPGPPEAAKQSISAEYPRVFVKQWFDFFSLDTSPPASFPQHSQPELRESKSALNQKVAASFGPSRQFQGEVNHQLG